MHQSSVSVFLVKRKRFGTRESDAGETDAGVEKPSETSGELIEEELQGDLQEAFSIIKKEGGRITQKELRKKMGYSEAKMSLLIADLERRNIVEKVKKGRGNIIFLKDSES